MALAKSSYSGKIHLRVWTFSRLLSSTHKAPLTNPGASTAEGSLVRRLPSTPSCRPILQSMLSSCHPASKATLITCQTSHCRYCLDHCLRRTNFLHHQEQASLRKVPVRNLSTKAIHTSRSNRSIFPHKQRPNPATIQFPTATMFNLQTSLGRVSAVKAPLRPCSRYLSVPPTIDNSKEGFENSGFKLEE
ncbi:hypothetical protein K458DRAFT_431824, partial [Lentithecium fluviatile CBS 122367]